MALNRIFILDASIKDSVYHNSTANFFYDPEYCRKERFWPCYFMPISNCSLSEDDIASVVRIDKYLNKTTIEGVTTAIELLALQDRLKLPRIVRMETPAISLCKIIPQHFETWFSACAPGLKYLYERWLKAYLIRFNSRSLKGLEERRGAIFGGRHVVPGTLSVHVRKGDKSTEMEVASDEDFIAAVLLLVRVVSFCLSLTPCLPASPHRSVTGLSHTL